ncbi:alpha/beta-hydrolase [Aulographum hederae CBS 113979]|uniref:Alpha/beta-hydrolase n=1 Tax=Aulographum hederae CBS 113979 TaxID=1176131 RepID=A0A6G1HAY8_9PEZI|nr:alpha/beta-hydrolase [Aulographum hederae CBS 113979]
MSRHSRLSICTSLPLTVDDAMKNRKTIPSPRDTLLPTLSREQMARLPYPPNILPGARDVDTMYGIMRVYEFGPENGRKVVFVHGEATALPIFARIAHGLAKKGCRVLLFDLWGHGYSDAPLDVPYDTRLFTTQIHFAITSSPIPWTGSNNKHSPGISLIAFSLGASIAVDFASTYPYLTTSLILLAPIGLLQSPPAAYIPLIQQHSDHNPITDHNPTDTDTETRTHLATALSLTPTPAPTEPPPWHQLLRTPTEQRSINTLIPPVSHPLISPAALTQWQFDTHHGFSHAILSILREAPFTSATAAYDKLARLMRGENAVLGSASCPSSPSLLHRNGVLVLLGDEDEIVPGEEAEEDLVRIFGSGDGEEGGVEVRFLRGGHGFVWPNSEVVVQEVVGWWGLRVRKDSRAVHFDAFTKGEGEETEVV